MAGRILPRFFSYHSRTVQMEAPCPTSDSLISWVLGDLPDHEATAVLDHLDTCRVCERFVVQAEAAQTLPASAPGSDFHEEPQCHALVGKLSAAGPMATKAAPEDLSGDQIRDYQLIRQIGRGGMGIVYLARHLRLNKPVAIKLVPGHSHDDLASVTRFEREMQAVGRLNHPNVVRALDAGDVGGVYFLTMELIEGCDLSKLLQGGRQLAVPDAAEIVRQAAMGLQYAHQQGLIHRDVKPSNLMLSRDSDGCVRIRVLDLGLAMLPESRRVESMLTDQNLLIGTLEYMAPEQSENMHTVDHLADVYALGATLYRLLTGRTPFSGPEYRKPANRLLALITQDAASLATHCPDAPPEIVDLVDRMLSRDSAVRPQSMAEVAEVLSPFASSAGLAALLQDIPTGLTNHEPTLPDHNALPVNAPDDTSPTAVRTIAEPRPSTAPTGTSAAASGGRTGRAVRLALGAAIPLFLLAALIWIQTDGGYIRVEYDDDIQLTLQVVKDGIPQGEFELQQLDEAVFYRTGDYEFKLPRATGDAVQIQNGNFRLRRNDRQVVKITHVTDRKKQFTGPSLPNTSEGTADNSADWTWSQPAMLNERLLTEWKDDQPTVSADGLTMIFSSYSIPRFSGQGDRDLWSVTRADLKSPWKTVTNLGPVINSSMKESHPTLHSPSGLLAFASNRPGGVGDVDIWYSSQSAADGSWTVPVNIGQNVNSSADDDSPEISSDGLTLVFSSTRSGGTGDKDLWVSQRRSPEDRWGTAKLLPTPVNSADMDSEPALSADQRVLVFTSNRPGGFGGKDLWACTRETSSGPWSRPFNLGKTVNTAADEAHAAFLPGGTSLVFASTRSGGPGGTDLWTVERLNSTPNDAAKLPASSTESAALSSQELAAWVIARKGTVLSDAGELTQLSQIPDGRFTISSVSIQKANADEIRRLADFVQHMPTCVRLSLLLGEFTDENVVELGRLKHLETLVVGSPAMTDQRLATVVGPALKMLTIFKAAVTSQGLRSVQQQCPNLKVLHVGSAALQDLRPIADMTQLTVLQINVSGPSSASDLLDPLQKSHVTDLTVKGKWHPEFAEVISLMPALQELHLQDCKALTDNALLQISSSSSLRTVRVTGPHRLSVAAVKSLRQEATNQEISVEGLVF